jgi:hypothetical protein
MDFRQVKIRTDPVTASLFKAACATSGVSMASEITRFMAECTSTLKCSNDKEYNRIAKRGGRRKEMASIIVRLEEIRDAEDAYICAIPENLQGSSAYESAESSIDLLEQAIELLQEAF